jgi:hypothetical protein
MTIGQYVWGVLRAIIPYLRHPRVLSKFSGVRISRPLDHEIFKSNRIDVKGSYRRLLGMRLVLFRVIGNRFWPQGLAVVDPTHKTWEKDVFIGTQRGSQYDIVVAGLEGPPLTVLAKITHEDPASPTTWRADLDPGLETIVLTALEREPQRRFQNAAEFADALERWYAGAVGAPAKARLLPGSVRTDEPVSLGDAATVAAAQEGSRPVPQRRRPWFIPLGCLAGVIGWLVLGGLLVAEMTQAGGCSTPTATAKKSIGYRARDSEELVREAGKGHLANVKRILSTGINPNAKNSDGQTALMAAAAGGHIEVANALLELLTAQRGIPYGAPERLEVNETDSRGETALMKAAEHGHADVVQALLDLRDTSKRGLDKPGKGNDEGVPAAAVNLKNDQGETALMKARKKNHHKVVEMLRKAGAKAPDTDK